MCIAIYLPKNNRLDLKTLWNCAENNPDGFGYAYFHNGIKIIKNVKITNSVLKEFIDTRERYIDTDFILHFRIATTGKISMLTTHPFAVNRNIVFCHNGILSDFSKNLTLASPRSDTMEFNRLILQQLPPDFMKYECYKYLLDEAIGYSNKMIFLNSDGEHWILNELQGEKVGDVWFSNSTFKEKTATAWQNSSAYWNAYYKTEKEYYTDYSKDKSKKTKKDKQDKTKEEAKYCKICGYKLFTATEQQKGVCWDCQYYNKKTGDLFIGAKTESENLKTITTVEGATE